MYTPASVANTNAWIALVKSPRIIIGIGTTNGTSNTRTPTTNSSARIFPNRRKDKDNGFVKSSKMFIGRRIVVGSRKRQK